PRERDDVRDAEKRGRHIDERNDDTADATGGPAPGALGKDQREVEEQRRQQQHRHRVAPEEHPVETIEPAAEREGEDPEEGDREPEEMQRRRVARPPQAYSR